MSEQDYVRFGELKIFMHQIYEFKKGVRNLVLCTMCPTCAALVAERLRGQRIEYLIQEVTDNKVNLYFGKTRLFGCGAGLYRQAAEPAHPGAGFHAGGHARLRYHPAVRTLLPAAEPVRPMTGGGGVPDFAFPEKNAIFTPDAPIRQKTHAMYRLSQYKETDKMAT